MINIQKCAVIGCGQVGATTAYTFAMRGLFSEIVLIDARHDKAVGEAMDIGHCLPFVSPALIYAGEYSDLSDAALIVVAAGASQREGETRLSLLSRNLKITESIISSITQYNKDGIILLVTNPVDILTYSALKKSGFPRERVIGSGTVLDTARLKYLLGDHLGVDSRNVHAFIIGEHGDSELALWSSANVSGVDLNDFCRICGKCKGMNKMNDMFEEVRNSAYKIIESKGATYYAIAQAVLRIAESIVRDEKSVLPVSTLVDGHYGLHDVCLGVPTIVGRGGAEKVLDVPLAKDELEKLHASAKVIRDELLAVGATFA